MWPKGWSSLNLRVFPWMMRGLSAMLGLLALIAPTGMESERRAVRRIRTVHLDPVTETTSESWFDRHPVPGTLVRESAGTTSRVAAVGALRHDPPPQIRELAAGGRPIEHIRFLRGLKVFRRVPRTRVTVQRTRRNSR
ncbi:hypothetical protein DW322_20510 [Rhodococcus rhodnii]|uniref:Uncharacterized protein n=2 Tax=Rhodococcus rhodnii TaxID=38312 RepID=R7WP79_9NOCA|nr:hypothetical protein Rrhod_1492 [Rhodococcus rhodnii LMG 5362]TXG92118.1 hypothetical protein DW322_20510 [Rhodococcus rhodnii]